mgnify:CR=1 FL=1
MSSAEAMRRALQDQLNATGCDAEFLSPAQTVEKVKADFAKWGKVIKDTGIRADDDS